MGTQHAYSTRQNLTKQFNQYILPPSLPTIILPFPPLPIQNFLPYLVNGSEGDNLCVPVEVGGGVSPGVPDRVHQTQLAC